jgi:hypothetical protein
MNTVYCNKPLDEAPYDEIHEAFAAEFPAL